MKKKVSLKDIANKVGVSTALVSYVLNNQKEGRINKEVAQKIRDTALELNYRPNQIAKSLKTNKTFTLGLIVADISNPFSSSLARYIENEAEKNNYTVLFASSDENSDRSGKRIQVLLDHHVDGLIIAPGESDQPHIQMLMQQQFPFVLIDRYFPELSTNYVAIDNFKVAHEAVLHLINNGFRRIGIITNRSKLHHMQERKRGYITALRQHGISAPKEWIREIRHGQIKKDIEDAIDELLALPQPVEAILFTSNKLSTHGLKYINNLSIKVPKDLAIVSFDETDFADLFYAPLTYIKQPLEAMSQMAVRVLLESINQHSKPVQVNMQAELIVQKSSRRL
ncbi:MAG TPA: substrate-binding domain-containing protein [Flavisolibacter sp.]|nr:substrate-binding domain-containing protein [Flavisolibacter sp.]